MYIHPGSVLARQRPQYVVYPLYLIVLDADIGGACVYTPWLSVSQTEASVCCLSVVFDCFRPWHWRSLCIYTLAQCWPDRGLSISYTNTSMRRLTCIWKVRHKVLTLMSQCSSSILFPPVFLLLCVCSFNLPIFVVVLPSFPPASCLSALPLVTTVAYFILHGCSQFC